MVRLMIRPVLVASAQSVYVTPWLVDQDVTLLFEPARHIFVGLIR